MCLGVSIEGSKARYEQWIADGLETVLAWKLVKVRPKLFRKGVNLKSLYYGHKWKAGTHKCSQFRRIQALDFLNPDPATMVENGIHVYLSKKKADIEYELEVDYIGRKVTLMKVECPVNQFIGCDLPCECAAFKQVVLTREEYDRIQKEQLCA